MVKIGFVTVSDRASRGEYEDLSGPCHGSMAEKRCRHAL